MIPVSAAGGVVYRRIGGDTEVLLIYRNSVWDLPKGKQEEDETVEECARREVAEEVGIPLPTIERFLIKTYHEYHRGGNDYAKTTHWFSMKTSVQNDFIPQKNEGIEAVQWIKIEEAKRKVEYKNLSAVINTL